MIKSTVVSCSQFTLAWSLERMSEMISSRIHLNRANIGYREFNYHHDPNKNNRGRGRYNFVCEAVYFHHLVSESIINLMQKEYLISKLQEDSTPISILFPFDLNTFIFFLRHEYYAQPGHSRLVDSWLYLGSWNCDEIIWGEHVYV